jgi:hypothetical protein
MPAGLPAGLVGIIGALSNDCLGCIPQSRTQQEKVNNRKSRVLGAYGAAVEAENKVEGSVVC